MISRVLKRWSFDPIEKAFLKNSKQSKRRNSGSDGLILVQAPSDHYYLALYALVIAEIRKTRSVTVAGIYPNIITPKPRKRVVVISFIFTHLDRFFTKRKWKKLYKAIGVDYFVELDNVSFFRRISFASRAHKTWKNLHRKEDLLDLKIGDIPVGDLIYDTYLRFEVKPTVEIGERPIRYYIYKALCIHQTISALLSEKKILEYFSSYSTYIQHGIPVRSMLQKGITVYTSGNLQQKIKKMSNADVYHTAPHRLYKRLFDDLAEPERRISEGKQLLHDKFSGKITQANSYMRKSVFAEDKTAGQPFADTYDGIVFLHDFFDSPHIYSDMLFPDFYEWTVHTLNLIQDRNLNICVKPHPNQTAESLEIINQFKTRYPAISWIDTAVSNSVILSSGIKFGISVYGTVLHELAYHGKIAICAGDNPHAAFGFVYRPVTIEEYDRLILHAAQLPMPKDHLQEVCSFYYMHNVHPKEDLNITAIEILKNYNVFNSDSQLIDKITDAIAN